MPGAYYSHTEIQQTAHKAIWFILAFSFIFCVSMVIIAMPASAIWITPDPEDVTAAYYTTYFPNKTVDSKWNTYWVYNGYTATFLWSNPDGYYIDSIRAGCNVSTVRVQIVNYTTPTVPVSALTTIAKDSFTVVNMTAPYNTTGPVQITVGGTGTWVNIAEIQFGSYQRDTAPTLPPIANFTAAPTAAAVGSTIQFNDTSSYSPTSWAWDFGDGELDFTQNPTHAYGVAGTYSVTLYVNNTAGNSTKTRTDYIDVFNPEEFHVQQFTKNSESGVLIEGTTIGLKNTTSGKWAYSTAPTGYHVWSTDADGISLGQNQTIELYAYKSGYTSSNSTITLPYDFYTHYSFMVPTTVVNATGTGTLVVTAVKNADGTPLADVAIILDDNQLGLTNSAGAVTMRNVTAGARSLQASLSGYQSVEKDFSITAGETTMLVIDLTRNGELPIETYVSPTPTEYLVDTDGDGIGDTSSAIVGNYTPGQLNQTAASGIMGMLGMIFQIWPLIIVLILLKLLKVI